ncbi:hypothetical protein [Abditibacterium utsteinense]|nr:hypothetical protein [Abditibacterium utsteinense]
MTLFFRITFAALLLCAPAFAQTQKAAPKTPGNLNVSGDLSYRPNGVRLEANSKGPARVTLPQLDVTARAIALDATGKVISQVRAQNSVNLKLSIAPSNGTPARIEATCDSAVLTPRPLKLVLRGHLKGFYQIAGGARNTLSGDIATFTNPGGNLLADLTGGVSLVIPAQAAGDTAPGLLGQGTVTITAQRAQVNQGDGTATFAGNAHAVSKGGSNDFDVTAPRFTLTRLADGTISTLQTTGRTLVKFDLPPGASKPAADASAPQKMSLGTPTHVEVAADGAAIQIPSSTATFDGNVKGFYRLAPASGAVPGSTPQNYDFAGTKAVIRYIKPTTPDTPADFNLDVSGASLEGPAFNLGF